jgi:hypothetical protein
MFLSKANNFDGIRELLAREKIILVSYRKGIFTIMIDSIREELQFVKRDEDVKERLTESNTVSLAYHSLLADESTDWAFQTFIEAGAMPSGDREKLNFRYQYKEGNRCKCGMSTLTLTGDYIDFDKVDAQIGVLLSYLKQGKHYDNIDIISRLISAFKEFPDLIQTGKTTLSPHLKSYIYKSIKQNTDQQLLEISPSYILNLFEFLETALSDLISQKRDTNTIYKDLFFLYKGFTIRN